MSVPDCDAAKHTIFRRKTRTFCRRATALGAFAQNFGELCAERLSRTARSEVPLRPRMAARAGREVVAAEGAAAVVTGGATRCPDGRVMHERLRRAHLPAARRARARLMTIGAA